MEDTSIDRRKEERRPKDYFDIEREIRDSSFPTKLPRLRAKLRYVMENSDPDNEAARFPGDEKNEFSYGNLTTTSGKKSAIFPAFPNKGPQYSKWKNDGDNWPFEKAEAFALLERLWTHSFWSSEEYRRRYEIFRTDGYFDALARQMRCERTTEQNLRHTAPGVYQLWRRSIIRPQRYLFGLFVVYRVRSTDSDADRPLKTIELHRLRGEVGSESNKGIVQVPELNEMYLGYMVKKSRQILVHSFDATTRAFHFTAITNTYRASHGDGGAFTVMAGLSTGLLGQQSFYTFPVVMIRDEEGSRIINAAAGSRDVATAFASEHTRADREAHKAGPEYGEIISPSEQKMLEAVTGLPLYQQLDLVERERVPPFVIEQFQKLQMMAPRQSDFETTE